MTNTDFVPSSNADVLKRFGRRLVMGRAWFEYKYSRGYMAPKNFADALRGAWRSFRAQIDRERKEAIKLAERKAAHTGDRNSRSPLNPYRQSNPRKAWGRGSDRYITSVMGR